MRVIRQMRCLGKIGRQDDALALADAEMPNWEGSPDFFFFVLGNLLLDRAVSDPAQAVSDWLPLAAGAWERCLVIGERPDLESSMRGCGSHLARHNLEAVHADGAAGRPTRACADLQLKAARLIDFMIGAGRV